MKPAYAFTSGLALGIIGTAVYFTVALPGDPCDPCDSCCPDADCFTTSFAMTPEKEAINLCNTYEGLTPTPTIKAMNIPLELFMAIGYEWEDGPSSGSAKGYRVYYGHDGSRIVGLIAPVDGSGVEIPSSGGYRTVILPSGLNGPCPDLCDTSSPLF